MGSLLHKITMAHFSLENSLDQLGITIIVGGFQNTIIYEQIYGFKNSHFEIFIYGFILVEMLLDNTDLLFYVINGQLDLIVDTPG